MISQIKNSGDNALSLLERKYQALDAFKNRLLKSAAKDKIAKLILHGSLLKGQAQRDSDIDLLVVTFNPTKQLQNFCSDLSFDVLLELEEKVEAFVFSFFDYKFPRNLFIYDTKKNGKEIFTMPEEEIKFREAQRLFDLAKVYLRGAKKNLRSGEIRIAIDASYNVCELCAKALLNLKIDEIPQTHRGVVTIFSRIYVKPKIVASDIGRDLNRSLDLRNQARYNPDAELSTAEAEAVIKLGEKLVRICEQEGV